jgi:hypothetical protein
MSSETRAGIKGAVGITAEVVSGAGAGGGGATGAWAMAGRAEMRSDARAVEAMILILVRVMIDFLFSVDEMSTEGLL